MALFLLFLYFCFVKSEAAVGSFEFCRGERYLGDYNRYDVVESLPSPIYGDDSIPSSRSYPLLMPSYETGELFLFGGYAMDSVNSPTPKHGIWVHSIEQNMWSFLLGSADHWNGDGDEARYQNNYPTFDSFSDSRNGGLTKFAHAKGPTHFSTNHPSDKEYMYNASYYVYGGLGYCYQREQGPAAVDGLWLLSLSELIYGPAKPWSWVQGTQDYSSFETTWVENTTDARNYSYNLFVVPRGRYGSTGVSIESGNRFFTFGGSFGLATDVTNELWEYKLLPTQEGWRILRGNPWIAGDSGTFGTKGEWGYDNIPPSRSRAMMWVVESYNVDSDTDEARIFLYGGASNVPFVYWGDVWEYSLDQNLWRWINGQKILQRQISYGSSELGEDRVYASGLYPGSRADASVWKDGNSLLLFGGIAVDSYGSSNAINDIWSFNVVNRQWMYIYGPQHTADEGTFSGNVYPSARYGAGFCQYGDKFYIHGGHSYTDLDSGYCSGSTTRTIGLISDQWTFALNESCNGYNVYDENTCSSRGRCYEGTCQCIETYEGDNCETKKRTCEGILYYDDDVCSGRGDCLQEEVCTCYSDINEYYGQYCKVNIGSDVMEVEIEEDELTHEKTTTYRLSYQVKETLIDDIYTDGSFNCSLMIRPRSSIEGVNDTDAFFDGASASELEDFYDNWLGLNHTCFFEMHPVNITTTLYFKVQLGTYEKTLLSGNYDAIERGDKVKIYILTSYVGTGFENWLDAKVRTAAGKTTDESGTFFQWLGGFMLTTMPVWIVLICCCCCCCCVTCIVCCIWLSVVRKQKKELKKFDDFSQEEVDTLLVDQLDMLEKSNFKDVKRGNMKKLFNIKFDSLEIEKALATGGSNAVIFRAKYKKKTIALKLFKTRDISTQESYDVFVKEAALLGKLKHPNILEFYGCTLDEPRVGIVMEYCGLGDVRQYLLNEDNPIFPTKVKLEIIAQVCDCMNFLNEQDIVHRDLKWDNVMFDDELVPKLIDFGLSKKLEGSGNNTYMTKQAGTSQYMAPEVTLSTTYGFKCDVFSMGIMMYELLTEDFEPYGRFPEFNVELKVALNPDFRPRIDEREIAQEECMGFVKELMIRAWDVDEDERPTFAEINEKIRENLAEVEELIKPYDEKVVAAFEKKKAMKEKLRAKALDTDQKE